MKLEVGKTYKRRRDGKLVTIKKVDEWCLGEHEKDPENFWPYTGDNGADYRPDGTWGTTLGEDHQWDLVEEVGAERRPKDGFFCEGKQENLDLLKNEGYGFFTTAKEPVTYLICKKGEKKIRGRNKFHEAKQTSGTDHCMTHAQLREMFGVSLPSETEPCDFKVETEHVIGNPCTCGAHATSTPQLHSEWCAEFAPKFKPDTKVAMVADNEHGANFEQGRGINSADCRQMRDDGIDPFPLQPKFVRNTATLSDWEDAIAKMNANKEAN